ncbi:MAG: protein translocase subunit SecD, partial [Phycisphaerae bacterium]
MHDPNRLIKWIAVIGLVVLSLLVLYPPSEKLKGGIDLVGGTSLLFEIDTTGLDAREQRGLSARVMSILRERVDPTQQLNLEWRPVGNNRIEIRMPRPPRGAAERRQRFEEAVDRLAAMNVSKRSVEAALNAPPENRESLVHELAHGVIEREPLLEALTAAHNEFLDASEDTDTTRADTAKEKYEEAVDKVLATSFPINRFKDVLALTNKDKREEELAKLRTEFPSYDRGSQEAPDGKLFTKAVEAYDAWAKDKAELEDPSDLKRRLRGAGVLEFIILADRDPGSPEHTLVENNAQLRQPIAKYVEQLQRYGPRSKAGDRYRWLPVDNVVAFMHLDDIKDFEKAKTNPNQPIVEEYAGLYYVLAHSDPEYGLLKGSGKRGWSLQTAYADQDPLTGRNIVRFGLDPSGGQQFGELTGNNIERNLCIVLDGTAMSHAVIQSRITQSGQISGDFTVEKVRDLVRSLEAGSLPARLKETPLSEYTIGPSLGETNRTKGMNAAIWGTITVIVFIFLYFGIWAGTVADLALALNLLFVLSIMALMQATFTLPGIAGLILTVGMAIDANVLIFERVREERDRGVVFKKALNAGYDKAFSTIMDANLTTLITCIILGFVGSEEVKGFAITLGIGISTSMFTALFVTRLIFNTLIAKGVLKDFSMRRIIGVPSVDWLALRRIFWPVSLVAV